MNIYDTFELFYPTIISSFTRLLRTDRIPSIISSILMGEESP